MKNIISIAVCLLTIINPLKAQNGFTFHPYPQTYPATFYQNPNDLFADSQNNIWFAFRSVGLGKCSGGSFTMFDTSNSGIPANITYAVVVDNLNNLWVATSGGLAKYDGTTWTVFDSINSPLPGNVYKLHMQGSLLWCGTNKGAVSFDGSVWTIYNNQNSGIAGDTITAFASGSNGELWIGTSNMGVSSYYNNTWSTFNTSNSGLASNNIKKIATDANNDTWFVTIIPAGLYKKSGSIIYNFIDDLYTGVYDISWFLPVWRTLLRDQTGKIIFPYFDPAGFNYQTINGNSIDIFTTNHPFSSVSAGNSLSVADLNNVCWNTSHVELNGVWGIVSFDKSQSVPAPFIFTNNNAKMLDINDVKAAMLNRGDMHWDLGNASYTVPRSGGINSVFASALWMGGIDNQQQLHASAQTYRQQGYDYWPGPIDTVSAISDSTTAMLYDKIWKVDRNIIEDFKYHFNNGSVTSGTYPVPDVIATWPAHGTGNISRDLAPFVDFNTDGVYDPMDGDYPLIKGDQMLFWIFNDNLASHEVTDTLSLGIEVHASAYAYTCDQLPDSEIVMQQTTFYHYRIINRSPDDYHDFYIGLWCDNDLGNASDDYVGCDTMLNAGFVYNGDNDDESAWGYGLNPPMQNVKILDGPLADMGDGADNDHDGTIDEPGEKCLMSGFLYYNNIGSTPTGRPATGGDYYNYLRSIWLDDVPMTYGGDGHLSPGPVTKYIFNGTPYDTVSGIWTETTVGNAPSDRRMLLSSGPFSLPAGGETNIDFAYVFTRDTTGPNGLTTSIARNKTDLQRIQTWYDNQNFPSCMVLNPGLIEQEKSWILFNLQPNPATDLIYITSNSMITEKNYVIYDISGRTVLSGELNQPVINIRNLDNGMYFLEIFGNEGTGMKKFIKQ